MPYNKGTEVITCFSEVTMVHFSLATVYMTLIASNFLLIVIAACFWNKNLMQNVGYKLLAVFTIFTLLRFLFPFELPFSTNVVLPEKISYVVFNIYRERFLFAKHPVSLWTIFQCIWLIGSLISLARYIIIRKKANYYVLSNGFAVTEEEPYQPLLNRICQMRGKKNTFQVMKIAGISVPTLERAESAVFDACDDRCILIHVSPEY